MGKRESGEEASIAAIPTRGKIDPEFVKMELETLLRYGNSETPEGGKKIPLLVYPLP